MSDAERQAHWFNLTNLLELPPETAKDTYQNIVARYSEAHRHYHTLSHIHHMLQEIEAIQHQAKDQPALLLAVWLHDIVYDPRAKDNESQSADYADNLLTGWGISPARILHIKEMILATQSHQNTSDDTDTTILLDADLAILGSPPETYQQYAQAIRQEFAWVPKPLYRRGRKKILRGFLEKSRIYFNQHFYDAYETQARENILAEMESL